jgi:WD40 repeat protein/serine/threonine protein kinase
MAAPSACPSPDRLRQLLAAEPGAADHAELIAHLDECPACQRTLEELAGASPVLLGAAGALRGASYTQEAPLRHVLDHLETDATMSRLCAPQDGTTRLEALLRPAASVEALADLENYEVMEVLGQGGMGVVLKAYDRALKRWVAIKVLAPDLAGDRVARQRFEREAQAAAAVRHEHVITIHAVSEAKGLPFLVMEYVEGGSLQDYLDSHGPPPWRAIARLGAEVAEGLAAAHGRGLVHRDIKPSNILLQRSEVRGQKSEVGGQRSEEQRAEAPASALCPLTSDLCAKISDFGLARVADDARLTQSGIVPGTPMYMSPEQALCEPLDGRADLFSLGSALYVLCTGREPFPAGSPVAVLRQVCEATPPPIRELNPAIPDWLAAAVERLHAKRPADRFASAAEVADFLRYNLDHPDRPRRLPPNGPEPRARRRRRQFLLGAALVGALLAAVLLGAATRWGHLLGLGPGVPAGQVPLRATLRGHQGPVWSVAFAPDGRLLATGSDDATLRFWDAATGRQEAVLAGHTSAVLAVAFAHSGKFLLSGDSDGTLALWDVATQKEGPPLPHHSGNVRRLAISPDDRTVAVGGGAQGVELWDLENRTVRRTLSGRHGTVQAIAFASDGRTLATGDASGHIHLWDPASGEERASFMGDPLTVRALAFFPDSRALASAGTGDKDVKLWNIETRDQVATLSGYENPVLSLAISRDGRLLATGGPDGGVRVWDVPSVRALVALPAHQGRVLGVAFAPDGRTLATVGEDRLGKLWDVSGLDAGRR